MAIFPRVHRECAPYEYEWGRLPSPHHQRLSPRALPCSYNEVEGPVFVRRQPLTVDKAIMNRL